MRLDLLRLVFAASVVGLAVNVAGIVVAIVMHATGPLVMHIAAALLCGVGLYTSRPSVR